jgi:hypothetical protein
MHFVQVYTPKLEMVQVAHNGSTQATHHVTMIGAVTLPVTGGISEDASKYPGKHSSVSHSNGLLLHCPHPVIQAVQIPVLDL